SLSHASNINNQSGLSWDLSGSILPGEAMTCGFTSPENGGPHDFTHEDWHANTQDEGSYQWNGDRRDGAALYNGGNIVDAILIEPGSGNSLFKDGVLQRKSNVCEPNPN